MGKTKLILENGQIFIPENRKDIDLDKKEYFKIENQDFEIYDLDKHKIRPFIKDILNRQSKFLEIKYLRVIIIFLIVMCFGFFMMFLIFPTKGFITDEIYKKLDEKLTTVQTQKPQAVGQDLLNRIVLPASQTDKSIPNNHINIPKNKDNVIQSQGGL